MTKLVPGVNDLLAVRPDLASEWDPQNERKPQDYAVHSNKCVGWICPNNHRWKAKINQRSNGSGCPYCAGQLPILGETDLLTVRPDLASEWDSQNDKNPQDFTAHSHKRVWWICPNSHKWEATINARSRGNGCPYCAGKLPILGETDLLTVHPNLASEWDPQNDEKPQDFTAYSCKQIWWVCPKKHRWKSTIGARSQGSGCPYCAGKLPILGETDLQTVLPDLASEWDPQNKEKPQDFTAHSGKRVYWICPNNHRWKAKISQRSNGNGCPYCAGRLPIPGETDLLTICPDLASEWDAQNEGMPQDFTAHSGKRAWWICPKKHRWEAKISDRSGGHGCPYCAGKLPIPGETDLLTICPDLASEWDAQNEGRPQDFTAHSSKRAWWICPKKHRWEATISARSYGQGCPYCAGQTHYRKKYTR